MGGLQELPEGPVTIMFTDIEGSTALRTQLGDADADLLFSKHDELIRNQIAAHRGNDQEAALGDGFLAVFQSTRRALACAIAIQTDMDAFNRGRSGPVVNVRIGLNTGEVAWAGKQLSGEAVHAAARVCAAASGGQILVSDVTRQLAGTIPDVTMRDAGEFQLKGFPQPWRLWEIVWIRETRSARQQVFVGRQAELEQLRGRLADALEGRGGLVMVGGEPGVGKTTLVKQLIAEAEQRGALAVFGRCYESEGTIPYSPFVEMLEQSLAIMPPDIVREDMGDDAPEVARMVPELRRRFPDIGEPLDLPPEQQQRYFFNAVGSFVARGSERFPLLMIMDDVHWADESTLLLVEHMAAMMPQLRVLGVGTYRDVELDVSRPLVATLERLLRGRLVERLPVRRFDRETVGTMIEGLAGKTPPSVVIDAIYSETEGNPFFVEEVFRHLAEEGKLFDGDAFRTDIEVDELDVPESVRLVVGRRLERLGPEARKVLAAGAVVGRAFAFNLLQEIVDADSDTLLDVVDAAEEARVIVAEARGGDVHYSFGHELVRQTLLSGLSVLRRQRLHLAVADAIERTDARAREERPSEIAHHLVAAGSSADPARTVEMLELAADRAFTAAAFEESLRLIDDALAVIGDEDALRSARLRQRRGSALQGLGRLEESITQWNQVVDVYAAAGLNEEAAKLCRDVGYQYAWLNRFPEAFASYAHGLDIIGEGATPWHSHLLALNGGMLGLAGAYEDALVKLDEAEAIARQNDDDRALGTTLWARSMAQWSNGWPRAAIESGREAIAALRRANDQWTRVDALAWTSYPLLLTGQPAEIEEGYRIAAEAMELGERLGHRAGALLGLRGVGMAEAFTSDLGRLEQIAQRDLEGFTSINSPWACLSHLMVTSSAMLQGDLDRAHAHAQHATALEPASAWTGVSFGYHVLVHAWRGEAEVCRRMLDATPVPLPVAGARPSIGIMLMTLTLIPACCVARLPDQAASLYLPLTEWLDELGMSGFDCASAQRVAGMAAAAGRRWDDAERHFEEALRANAEVGNRIDLPQVEHWYAEMLLDRGAPGDDDRARLLLTSAISAYRTLGMPILEARATEALARI